MIIKCLTHVSSGLDNHLSHSLYIVNKHYLLIIIYYAIFIVKQISIMIFFWLISLTSIFSIISGSIEKPQAFLWRYLLLNVVDCSKDKTSFRSKDIDPLLHVILNFF